MKLNLRNFRSVIILHVKGDVSLRDVDVLATGIPSVVRSDLPFVLNFEDSIFEKGVKEKLDVLKTEYDSKKNVSLFISATVDGADAISFKEALNLTKNAKTDVILKCIELEKELEQLETKNEELGQKISEAVEGKQSHSEVNRELEAQKYIAEIYSEVEKADGSLVRQFGAAAKKAFSQEVADSFESTRQKVLELMREKKVNIG